MNHLVRTSNATGRSSRLGRAAAIVAVALIVAAGCSSNGTDVTAMPSGSAGTAPTPAPRQGGKLVVAVSSDPDGFNPATNQWSGPAFQMARTVLDPLVVMDRNHHWQPYLAQSITPNQDFTVWTFTLRPGVTFHNGEKLDADALVTFFNAVIASPITSQGFAEKPQVTATGPMTVTLTFTKPWSEMPTVLADQPGYVIAPAQISSGDTKHPIGTGPFVFDEWVPGDHFTATRNPHYWRDNLPYLDSIEFKPIVDAASRENALRAGDADMIELDSVGQPKLDDLTSGGFRAVSDVDSQGVNAVLMNTGSAALQDKRVREAVVASIDRDAYRDTVLDDSFQTADQPYAPGSPWHTDVSYPTFDLARAKSLVADYEAQHGPVSITIMDVSGNAAAAVQFLQQEMTAAGITVSVDTVDAARFTKQFVTGKFDMVYVTGFLPAADPDASYPFLTGKNADPSSPIKLNFTEYRNDALDHALEAQRTTADETARRSQWATIWSSLATDVPYAYLAYDRAAFVTNTDVYGVAGFTTPEGVPLPAINHWTPFYTGVYRSSS
jgi:ABC-type transport system substrate-binding protein